LRFGGGQSAAHCGDREVEAGTHGAEGEVEGFGDLGVAEALGEAEVEHFAMLAGEVAQGFVDAQGVLGPSGEGGESGRVPLGGALLAPLLEALAQAALAPPGPPGLETEAAGDAEEIGSRLLRLGPVVHALRQAEEGLLHEVVSERGVGVTAREEAGERVGVLPEEAFEFGAVVNGLQGG